MAFLSLQWTPGQPEYLLNLKPQQGPLHVLLNSQEDLVQVYHPWFDQLYKICFGTNNQLPQKPKPFRVSTLIAAAFGGWLQVRDIVIPFLQAIKKDPETQALLLLMEELIPLTVFYYNVYFRGGHYEQWKEATTRLGIMYIGQKRKNYDKATMSRLSDLLFEEANNRSFNNIFRDWLNVITEKKVSNWEMAFRFTKLAAQYSFMLLQYF